MNSELPPLINATAETLILGLEQECFTSPDLVKVKSFTHVNVAWTDTNRLQAYLDRIERVNHLVNAVMELNPDAIAIATQLDGERKQGKVRGYVSCGSNQAGLR